MSGAATVEDGTQPWESARPPDASQLHLVIAWSLEQPGRIGESAEIAGPTMLGRGEPEHMQGTSFARFVRWRPHATVPAPPLGDSRISRSQLIMRPRSDGSLGLENVGRCKLFINGEEASVAALRPGDTITLRNALVLLVVRRDARAVPRADAAAPAFAFAGPDRHGIVGESAAAWQLRAELAFAAATDHHVLLRGASGVGKELAARALHALSSRAGRPLIARNAATLPEGLVDAELFGTARNYPNVGSPERAGLIGEADGSFLFLDEIGELPPALQAHLLRVLDRGGEYQRLGESRLRRSDLRLIGATNRDLAALKHDFAARFTSRIELPGLEARREDIPLLLRNILRRAAAHNPTVAERFCSPAGADGERELRVDPWLVEGLLRHRYTLHTRELERLVWRAIATSTAEFVGLTPEVRAELDLSSRPSGPESSSRPSRPSGRESADNAATTDAEPARAVVSHDALGREQIVAALAAASGRTVVAAEKLGLRNRYVLYRLMKKFGIQISDE